MSSVAGKWLYFASNVLPLYVERKWRTTVRPRLFRDPLLQTRPRGGRLLASVYSLLSTVILTFLSAYFMSEFCGVERDALPIVPARRNALQQCHSPMLHCTHHFLYEAVHTPTSFLSHSPFSLWIGVPDCGNMAQVVVVWAYATSSGNPRGVVHRKGASQDEARKREPLRTMHATPPDASDGSAPAHLKPGQ